ncbi:DUF7507 domain-containing protein, partial [Wenzhouxiangella limi]
PIEVGSILEYTLTATNNGNVTLGDVMVSDDRIDPNQITCSVVAPEDTCVLVGRYVVTQADVDAGQIVNTGVADGTDPDGVPVGPVNDDETVALDQSPAIELDKDISAGNPYLEVGDAVGYEITATNTGNVTLRGVEISDPQAQLGECVPAQPAVLSPGDRLVCPASYETTQAEIDAGSFTNVATVAGTDPNGSGVADEDDATAQGPQAEPSLVLLKRLTSAPDPIEVGSILEYTLTATNNGNVTLSEVEVSDDRITPSSTTCDSVAPTETCELVGTYTVTQADVDVGEIINTGSADGTDPDGAPVGPVNDDETVALDQSPAIELDKVISDGSPFSAVDDVITYEITATNTGNVTLRGVEISDPQAELVGCTPEQPATLAPEAVLVCQASFTITQAEIDAGEFTNEASVTGTGPNDQPVGDDDDATAAGPVAGPALELTKQADTAGPVAPDDVVVYTLTATNTGNVSLLNVELEDDMIELACDPVTPVTVAPGDDLICTGSYTVQPSDIGQALVNVATVTGVSEQDQSNTVKADDEVTISTLPPVPVPVTSPLGRAILILLIMLLAIGGIYGQHRPMRYRG